MQKKEEENQTKREQEKCLWTGLLKQILEIHSQMELERFLSSIMSDYEKKMISRRLNILLMLKEGRSYREIGRELWVSPSTITAIRKSILSNDKYITRRIIDAQNKASMRSKQKRRTEFVINRRLEIFLDAILNGKNNMRARYRSINN